MDRSILMVDMRRRKYINKKHTNGRNSQIVLSPLRLATRDSRAATHISVNESRTPPFGESRPCLPERLLNSRLGGSASQDFWRCGHVAPSTNTSEEKMPPTVYQQRDERRKSEI